jgi:transcriptional regulator with XRE-family HTH domain
VKLEDLGHRIRQARTAKNLTQEQLAKSAGVSRTTLNLLENGLVGDVGLKKAEAILEQLGLSLSIGSASKPARPDFLKMASTSASTRSRTAISESDLRRVFVTGKVAKQHRAHIRDLLEGSPSPLLKGMLRDISSRHKPGRVEKNLYRIAAELQLPTSMVEKWLRD